MKKLLLILSALLFITGCEVESTSNVIDDKYSDGIYLFYARHTPDWYGTIKIEYIYNTDTSKQSKMFYINEDSKVSEIIKVDVNNLSFFKLTYISNRGEPYETGATFANLNKDSFKDLDNGLYAAEVFRENRTDLYLRKTKSINYYLNNVNFYDEKNVLFIKGGGTIYYQKFSKDSERINFELKKLSSIILYNPPRTTLVNNKGETHYLDCSTIQTEEGRKLDLTKLGDGYFYTELKSDGHFTTPVKLNSYKDIINN